MVRIQWSVRHRCACVCVCGWNVNERGSQCEKRGCVTQQLQMRPSIAVLGPVPPTPPPPTSAPHICRRVGTDASSARSISLLRSVQQRLSKALTTTRYRCMFEWQDGCLHCAALLTRKLFSAQYLKYGPEIIQFQAACHCSQRTSTCSSELFLYSSPICV